MELEYLILKKDIRREETNIHNVCIPSLIRIKEHLDSSEASLQEIKQEVILTERHIENYERLMQILSKQKESYQSELLKLNERLNKLVEAYVRKRSLKLRCNKVKLIYYKCILALSAF